MNERSKISGSKNVDKEVLLAPKSERVEMTLNTANSLTSGLLIKRLTELYENPIEASVRETVSNAFDAVSVNCSGNRPIVKITAPSTMNPVLIISDNGIGMSYEDLKEIYSKYGASTKIDDFNQVGAYGLGAKSPLAYGTEFTVTSIKDGVKTSIIVVREELTNYIKIVDSIYTEESSGTVVSIPVSNSDIEYFVKEVKKYTEHPVDKDVELYVNGKIVKNNDYTLANDEVVIFEGNEIITGRVWVKTSSIPEFIINYNKDDFRASLKYIIGGWVYFPPSSNRYRSESEIIVELKAGVVGFNSSRDSILNNDRYRDLEEKVLEYLLSVRFSNDLSREVNKFNLLDFKEFLGKLLNKFERHLYIKENKLTVDFENARVTHGRYQPNILNLKGKVDIHSFVHEETGLSLNNVVKDYCGKSDFFVFTEKKEGHKVSLNYRYLKMDGFFTSYNAKLNRIGEEILAMNSRGSNFEGFFIENLLKLEYDKSYRYKPTNIFVTDMTSEKILDTFKKKRKSITETIRFSNVEGKSSYAVNYILTSATKKEIQKMIHTANISDVIIKIISFEEAIKETKKKIAAKPPKEKIVKKQIPFVTLYKYTKGTRAVMTPEIDKTEKNVIILDRYITNEINLERIANWYANKHNIKKSDFNLYVSSGSLTPVDVEYILTLGEVYEYPTASSLGKSKLYKDKIANKKARLEYLYTVEKEKTDVEIVINIICGLTRRPYYSIRRNLADMFSIAKKAAEILKVDFIEEDDVSILKVLETEFDKLSHINPSEEYNLMNDKVLVEMAKMLSSETLETLNDTLVLMESSVTIDMNTKEQMYVNIRSLDFYNLDLLERESSYGSRRFVEFQKEQLRRNVEFAKDVFENLNKIS